MRLALIGPIALSLMIFSTGCSNEPDKVKAAAAKTKTAIERVLKADERLAKERNNLPPNATPSQIAWSIGIYSDGLERLDMSDCPADFRVAYRQHTRAWRDTQAAVKQLPDGFLEGVLLGAFNGVLRGEMDGGASRLEGDLKRAIERVRTTWEDVEKIGAKYGAAL